MTQEDLSVWVLKRMQATATDPGAPGWLVSAAARWIAASDEFSSWFGEAKRLQRNVPVTLDDLLMMADSDERIMQLWLRFQSDEDAQHELEESIAEGVTLRTRFIEH